ncbi:MAG: DNA polymerase III subunit gamma/tau [Oscillospiraceae bacterium]
MYQALYRKYRPQTFDDVVGQQGVTQTLKNQLQTGRLSHAYLFTGTRGTGKTTCAKILAKAVNCENPQDGNPCNRCAACRSIDAGACMDVLEIDAASNNGVDSVRALRDDAVYTPAEVKKRVYIIDEVHMLSLSAFNALLKIIEEPPEHLLFILATTELHKVPATILSRCQRFAFRRIVPEDIVGRLNYIAYQESIELEPDAAAFLARLADGGLRDAVSLLDQCASAAQGAVTVDEACKVLGLAGARQTAALMEAVGRHDAAAALSIFNTQYAEGKDLGAMLDELCAVARDLLILRTAPQAGIQMISGICTPQELRTLQPLLSPGELLRITAVLRDTAAGFNASANRRIDAELLPCAPVRAGGQSGRRVAQCPPVPRGGASGARCRARRCRTAAGGAGTAGTGSAGGAGGCPGAAAACAHGGPAGLLAGARQAAENDAPAAGAGHVLHAGQCAGARYAARGRSGAADGDGIRAEPHQQAGGPPAGVGRRHGPAGQARAGAHRFRKGRKAERELCTARELRGGAPGTGRFKIKSFRSFRIAKSSFAALFCDFPLRRVMEHERTP